LSKNVSADTEIPKSNAKITKVGAALKDPSGTADFRKGFDVDPGQRIADGRAEQSSSFRTGQYNLQKFTITVMYCSLK
jgi:hypothetical protein